MKKLIFLLVNILATQSYAKDFNCRDLFDASLSTTERQKRFKEFKDNLDFEMKSKEYSLSFNDRIELGRITKQLIYKISCKNLYELHSITDERNPTRVKLMKLLLERKESLDPFQSSRLEEEINRNKNYFSKYSSISYLDKNSCSDSLVLRLNSQATNKNGENIMEYRYNNHDKISLKEGFVAKGSRPLCGNEVSDTHQVAALKFDEKPHSHLDNSISCGSSRYKYNPVQKYKLKSNLADIVVGGSSSRKKITLEKDTEVQFVSLDPLGNGVYQVKFLSNDKVYYAIPCKWAKSVPVGDNNE